MEEPDLESVIERAQGHDAEALGEIYRLYVRRVFGLCRYMLDSRESAEDVTSEVFLKLQRSIESYDGSIPFPRWLLKVAGNQCIDALRRRKCGRHDLGKGRLGQLSFELPELLKQTLTLLGRRAHILGIWRQGQSIIVLRWSVFPQILLTFIYRWIDLYSVNIIPKQYPQDAGK